MNPISWPIDDRAVVRSLTLDDAEVVYRAVEEDRARLRHRKPDITYVDQVVYGLFEHEWLAT